MKKVACIEDDQEYTVSEKDIGLCKKILFLSLPFMLVLVVGELLACLFFPAPLPWLAPQSLFESSASLGFRLQPNQSAYTADKPFHTNAMGLRGALRGWQKPSGVQRLLILGDSIAAGYGVREEDTFAAQLEGLLNSSGRQQQWEVINTGVPAYDTTQEVTYFQAEGIYFAPDVVILALYWNDINTATSVRVDAMGRLFEGDKEPGWFQQVINSPQVYKLRNFIKQSRLLYVTVTRLQSLQQRFSSEHIRTTQMSVLLGTPDPRVEQGWNNVEKQLLRLAQLCRQNDIQLLILILPMPEQLSQSYTNIKYQSVVQSICERHSLWCLDLLQSFKRAYQTHTSLFIAWDEAHPNEKGHNLIARELYKVINGKLP